MTSDLLHELANMVRTEADAISQPYAWPSRGPMSDEERLEMRRLDATERAIRYRAYVAEYEEAGQHKRSTQGGSDE